MSELMSHDKKFDQIWQFRRRDDDNDSSSDDSRSNSHSDEPVPMKHNTVLDLVLPENDQVTYFERSHEKDIQDQGTTSLCVKGKKRNTNCNGLRTKKGAVKKTKKTARAPRGLLKKEANIKKSKKTSQVTLSEDLKLFTKTVIEELRVARENMFVQMREDMGKLVTLGSTTKPKRKRVVRKTSQKQPQKKRGAASNKPNEAKKSKKVEKEKSDNHNDQTNETITSDEKEKDVVERSSIKKNSNLSVQPDQLVSKTSYLTTLRSSLISESQATGNDSSLKLERGKVLINSNGNVQPNYFPSIQTDESFRSYAQMGLKDSESSFCMGTGFPIPLHWRLDNNFNAPRQVLGSSTLRMNGGGVRLSSGIRALPDHLTPNNFQSFYPN